MIRGKKLLKLKKLMRKFWQKLRRVVDNLPTLSRKVNIFPKILI